MRFSPTKIQGLWALLTCSMSVLVVATDEWATVRTILGRFPIRDMAFSAGVPSGRKFVFEKGSMTMSSPLAMASASKFPAAMAVVASLADSHLSFDTFAYEIWPWWTARASDPRSRVTLRSLLSFTSGFWAPDAGGDVPCIELEQASSYTAEACANEIYLRAPHEFEPGSTWAYNSFHLQVAGAMAAEAANLSVQGLLHKYLIWPLNLTTTRWLGGENPILAGALVTSGNDYDKILRAYLAYELLPQSLVVEMERDYLKPPVKVANSSRVLTKLLGHYSMCNYFECLPPKLSDFTSGCEMKNIHIDPGLFGYYPLVDRRKSTYMQIVRAKVPSSRADFFVPTMTSALLRRVVKGHVDSALAAEPFPSQTLGTTDSPVATMFA